MQGELKIHFCSDTCFSMPAALDATYDANVAIDRLGLPVAPGKTLHGLLRDTWLTVQDTLDKNKVGALLLGTPLSHTGEGLLRIGDARVDMATREWIQRAWDRPEESRITVLALRDAFLVSRTMTSEDRNTGAPKQDTLRVVRMVPAGTVLIAPLTLKTPHIDSFGVALSPEEKVKQRQAALDLLDLLARLTRHVGLDRNRGLGHVCMKVNWPEEVTGTDVNAPPDHSGAVHETALMETAQDGVAEPGPKEFATNAKATVRFWPLRLTLTAPCLLADRSLDPNSRATKSFVTGAALRGAIADALVRSGATEDELREILVSGTVRFLNAYPAQQYVRGKYRRSLPPPITWQRSKDPLLEDKDAEPQNLLLRVVDEATPEFDTQMTNLNASFFAANGSTYVPVEAKRRFSTHQQRDRTRGMATKGQATVFVYEALEADQTFLGAIALPANRTDLQIRLRAALAEPLWLGRSQRSGYGGAPVVAQEESNWNGGSETGKRLSAISEGTLFQVRLTSDAILRDPVTGQHDPWQLGAALQARFTERETGEQWATINAVCVAAGTAQGYNSLWRTALPALPCVLAGSVALLTANVNLSADTLTTLQAQPIGERVAEGRGCFLIETEGVTGDGMLTIQKSGSDATQEAELPMDEPETLVNAQKRLYLLHLRRALGDAALQIAKSAIGLPSPSLIQRMRTPLGIPSAALPTQNGRESWQQTYIDWFTGSAGQRLRDKANKELERCYVKVKPDNSEVSQTLAKLLLGCAQTGRIPVADAFGAERQGYQITSGAIAERLWNEAWTSLTLYFLDTLLNGLARKAKDKSEPNRSDSTGVSETQGDGAAGGEGGNGK